MPAVLVTFPLFLSLALNEFAVEIDVTVNLFTHILPAIFHVILQGSVAVSVPHRLFPSTVEVPILAIFGYRFLFFAVEAPLGTEVVRIIIGGCLRARFTVLPALIRGLPALVGGLPALV